MEPSAIRATYIGGAWQETQGGGAPLALLAPATGQAAAELHCASPDMVRAAVAAAAQARGVWGTASVTRRLAALDGLIAGVEARAEAFAQVICAETGAPIDFARSAQVAAGLAHLRATRDALAAMEEDVVIGGDPLHRLRYAPLGVAALITPWNWPLNQVVLKVGAALAAGCPMVLKPSEHSTRTALLFAEVVAGLELPAGVFNLVPGDGRTGAALVAQPEVDIVSFTGSTRAGREIATQAARRFARTTLELGGKSPNLVFEDCDLELAMRQGLAHCFRNAGQSCNAASRMLVARPVYDAAVALAAEITKATPVGPPSSPGAHLGPLINAQQFDRVQGFITEGLATGLRLVAGGAGRPEGLEQGFFARPTVFANVPPSSRLFREEIFGPVLTMTPFDSEAEAVRLANDTPYGLAAYVQTGCQRRADRVARQLQAGMIQVNGTSRAAGAPFGGRKSSGHGREAGIWGIRSFQEVTSISGAARADFPGA